MFLSHFCNNEAVHSISSYGNYSCPDPFEDWQQGAPYCYLLKSGNVNFKAWDDAQESCFDLGGSLASLTNEEERNYVIKYINDTREEIWIGLMGPDDQGNP